MDKKSMVEEDRSKILSVIEELDLKKDQVIREAWDKVNHDFNSILNSLLPSAEAKLMPVEGAEYLQGLKVSYHSSFVLIIFPLIILTKSLVCSVSHFDF